MPVCKGKDDPLQCGLETCTGQAARPERAGPKRAGLTNRQSGTGRAGLSHPTGRAGLHIFLDNW